MSKRKEKREKKNEAAKLEKRAKKVEKQSKRQLREAQRRARANGQAPAPTPTRTWFGEPGFAPGEVILIMGAAMSPGRLAQIREQHEELLRGPARRRKLETKKPGSAVTLKSLKKLIKKGQ